MSMPYRCSFCDIKTFYAGAGPAWRGRSPENILSELQGLVAEFGTEPRYLFVDDQFFGPGRRGVDRVIQLAGLLIDADLGLTFEVTCRADSVDAAVFSRLQEAGLAGVYMGLDSGSQRQLDRYRKDTTVAANLEAVRILRHLEIPVDFGFIMFDPGTAMDDLRDNARFLSALSDMGVPVHPEIFTHTLKLYPGTPVTSRYFDGTPVADPRVLEIRGRLLEVQTQSDHGEAMTMRGKRMLSVLFTETGL